jgi:hypothetical protein
VDRWSHPVFQRAHRNARHLIDRGSDPLRVVCDRAHEKGMLFYPTLLVQQGRGDRETDVRCSEFRFNNTHLEIGAPGDLDPSFPGYTFLDFSHEEVREERFALIDETLKNYPVDGFELQLNYGLYYFHPDRVDQGREIMTEWIRRIHRRVKESGDQRELAIRVPASLDGCYSLGLDVRRWIRDGLVDTLIGQGFSGPELMHQMINFRPLVQAARGYPCRIMAAIQSLVDSDRLYQGTIEIIRAAACNYWDQGVDGLYLAHWFANWPYDASFYEKLRELPHPDIMATRDKFYYLPTTTGRYEKPELEPGLSMDLPVVLEEEKAIALPFIITDDIPGWEATGRIHEVILRFRIMNITEQDRLSFALNGQRLPDRMRRVINEMYRMKAPRYRTGSGYWFVFRLKPGFRPVRGANTLRVTLHSRTPDLIPEPMLRDVELEIKYLMGKHFNRGQDSDLGPYEYANI